MTHTEKIQDLEDLVLNRCKKLNFIPAGHGVRFKIEFVPLKAFAQIEISTRTDSILDMPFMERFEEWIEDKCARMENCRQQQELRIKKTRVLSVLRLVFNPQFGHASNSKLGTLTIREVASTSSHTLLSYRNSGPRTVRFLNEFLEEYEPGLKLPF